MRIKFLLSFVAVFWCGGAAAYGQTTTWIGATTNITTPANWTAGVPTSATPGIINACNTNCPKLAGAVTFTGATITIQTGGNIDLNGRTLTLGSLIISTSVTFSSATNSGINVSNLIINSGIIVNSAAVRITATTLLSIQGGSTLNSGTGLLTATTLDVLGGSTLNTNNVRVVTALNINASIVKLGNPFSSNATVNVLNGGNINLNTHTLTLSTVTGVLNISTNMTLNAGAITVTTLNISNASTFNSGSAVITATTLNVSNNSTLNSGAGLLKATTLNVLSGSTLNIVNVQVVTRLNIDSGIVNLSNNFVSNATVNVLNGGNINLNTHTLTLSGATGILNIFTNMTLNPGTINATTINITNTNPSSMIVNFGATTISANTINVNDSASNPNTLNTGSGSITATTINVLGTSTLNINTGSGPITVTTLKASGSSITERSTINLDKDISTTNFLANFSTINLRNRKLTTTNATLNTPTLGLVIIGSTVVNGELAADALNEIKGSTFDGGIKITALKGKAFGGNTFNGITNFELSNGNGSGALNLNTSDGSTYVGDATFKNTSTSVFTIVSHSNNNTTSNFNAQTTFINENGGTINVATNNAIVNAKDVIVQNTMGTFTLATGTTTKISGTVLTVTNGSITNLLSGNAIGTFNSVSLTNTASSSTITTASATTNNKLNINSSLSVVFATGVNTINLNKVICGISVPAVTIDVLSSANLNLNASTFNDLSITNNLNLNVNSSVFKDLSITDNSNNVVTISTITCLGNFLLERTSSIATSIATNILGVNTFNKNVTINKEVNISNPTNTNINNIHLVADNQFINSGNNTTISIPRLRLNGKTTINTLVNITNRLTIGGVVDCLSGTLSNPKLHIAGGATISGAGANAFIMGAVKKMGLTAITSTTFLFPVGTIRVGQTPENKYTPLTLLTLTSLTTPLTTDFITVAYVPSASTHPNTNIISGSCEYWGVNSNFDGQYRFSLGTAPNFCTTKDNGTGLSAFHWADNIGNWANINTTFSVANQTITSTNTTTGFVSFKANENNEIALGYGSLLELDLSEVAVKDFIFVGSASILPSSILPPPPLTNFKSGLGSIFISPKFVGAALNGTLTLKFNNPTTDPISSIIEFPINKTTLLMAGSILKMGINSPPATTIPLDPKLYTITITNTSSREATIKFYKLPQIAPSTALGITSNLVNGIRFDTSLTFNFPVASPSQPQFRLDIIDASNNTPITNITTTLPNLTLTWTPTTTLAPGTYKFTLTDLSSSKVYNGQFIKQ